MDTWRTNALNSSFLFSTVICSSAWSFALAIATSAHGEDQSPGQGTMMGILSSPVVPHKFDDKVAWASDAEFKANWGLHLAGFHAAYNAGAYGQNVKVGVLDDGTWSGHAEFIARQNVLEFGEPFGKNNIPLISKGVLHNHGLHVAGVIGANRDGNGMHGGAYQSIIFAGVGAGAGSKFDVPGAAGAIIASGVDFLNNSWGYDFQSTSPFKGKLSEYAVPINVYVDGKLQISPHGPDINVSNGVSKQLFNKSLATMETMRDIANSGIVTVFAAGNDPYKSPLFRGISSGPLTAPFPTFLASGPALLKTSVSAIGEMFNILDQRLERVTQAHVTLSARIDSYRKFLADVDRLDTQTRNDPRIDRLNQLVHLLVDPAGGSASGYETLEQLLSIREKWDASVVAPVARFRALQAEYSANDDIRLTDVNNYIASAEALLGSFDVETKLHPDVRQFYTDLANFKSERQLYERGTFEPTNEGRALLGSVLTQGQFQRIEKNWLTVVNLSNDSRITSNSNICGLAKYYCLGAPGGSYSQLTDAAVMDAPKVPVGMSSFDQQHRTISNQLLPVDYQIFSLGIMSDAPTGSTAIEKQQAVVSAYQMMSGTSMAAPHATAGLAVIKSRFPYLENAQIRDVMLSNAKDVGAPGIDRVYGWGLMDLDRSMDGPAKLWQLKIDNDLTVAEKHAAEMYNAVVAKAEYYMRDAEKIARQTRGEIDLLYSAYEALMGDIDQLNARGKMAEAEAKTAIERRESSEKINFAVAEAQAKFAEANAKIVDAQNLFTEIRGMERLAPERQKLAQDSQLTRDQPNEPEDTQAAAFEYHDFRVNIPGEKTVACDSQACVADYWSNRIDGPGGLTKLGKGALALVGNNRYEGGTLIEEGVLQLGMGGRSGSVIGKIVNNGILAFDRSDSFLFDNVISGTGSLDIYAGTLRLQSASSYSGDTRVNGGSLVIEGSLTSAVKVGKGGRLGGAGSIGSLYVRAGGSVAPGQSVGTLHVAGNAQFEAGSIYDVEISTDRSVGDAMAVRGSIMLLGGVVAVRMEASMDQLTNGEAEDLLSRRYDILTAGQRITGTFGSVTPQFNYISALLDYSDARKVVLTFDYTQQAKSDEAKKLAAKLANQERELARLKAIQAPPQLPAQEEVQGGDSTALVPFEPATSVSQEPAVSAGTPGGSGNPSLEQIPLAPPADVIQPGAATLPVLEVDLTGGGHLPITPNNSKDEIDTAILKLEADIRRLKKELHALTLRELDLFGAVTPNRASVGEGVKSLGLGHPLVELLETSGHGTTPNFDSLSGEMHATLSGVLVAESRLISQAATDRLRSVFGEISMNPQATVAPVGYVPMVEKDTAAGEQFAAIAPVVVTSLFWGQAYGSWGRTEEDGNAAGYTRNTGGLIAGLDGLILDSWRLGLLAAYGNTSLQGSNSVARVDSYRLGVYSGAHLDLFSVRMGANFAWHAIETDRHAHWLSLSNKNEAKYNARSLEIFGEVGYRVNTQLADFEPFIGAAHVYMNTDGFKENGFATALDGLSDASGLTTGTIGLRATRKFDLGESSLLMARGMVGWTHGFGNLTPETTVGFIGGDKFDVRGVPFEQNAVAIEFGFDVAVSEAAQLGISYTGQFGASSNDNSARADLKVKF